MEHHIRQSDKESERRVQIIAVSALILVALIVAYFNHWL